MASPPSIGRSFVRPTNRVESLPLPAWTNAEVAFWIDEWRLIRDMCAGEREVKDAATAYLPQMEGMDQDEYASFLERATFFPFTARTASALAGSIFRRQELLENMPAELKVKLEDFTRDEQDFRTFSTLAAEEVIKLGRYGVLLDMPSVETVTPRPFCVGYTAENILDWDIDEIDGRDTLVMVVLREAYYVRDPVTQVQTVTPRYRQLLLDGRGPGRVYRQKVFQAKEASDQVDLTSAYQISDTVVLNRGQPLDFIPFVLVGAFTSTPGVEKPPMQDIARLNVSHFRSYASLEHGRFFAGFPIYYVEQPLGGSETDAEFELGASKVWVTPSGAKPGLLELNGQGLKFLVDALDQKEQQAATLGGRMMGVRTSASSESDNALKLSERNEQSILLKITRSLDTAFTRILRWWAFLQDVPKAVADKIKVEYNKDFLFDNGGAREFRAIQSMYKDGIIPIEVVYAYLKKNLVVPDWMEIEEFTKLLNSATSFPNETNFQARKEGYADAKSRDLDDQQTKQIKSDETIVDKTGEIQSELQTEKLESDEKKAETAAKAAKEAAKLAPKPVPGQPVGGPPQPGKPGKPGVKPPVKPPVK